MRRAVANTASGSVTVDFDPDATSVERLQWIIGSCGFRCRGEVTPRHVCTPDAAPARAAHEGHGAAPAQDQMAHEMGHGAGMDMAAMVRDMRNRFWIALAFTVPLFIYSPMGGMFTPPAPPFGLDLDLWLFFLGTAAIIYPSWPFFTAAGRAPAAGLSKRRISAWLSRCK